MNWSWGKAKSVGLHLVYGGLGAFAAYALKYVSGADWSDLGPFAPVIVLAVSTGLKAGQKWLADEEQQLPSVANDQ